MAGTIVAPDGITWMEYAAPSLVNAWAIAHSPTLDLFAAVSYNGYARVLTSSNGINWTLVVKGDAPGQYPKGWRDIVWGRNAFVAVGDKGILLSFDACNWTKPALPDLAYTSVTYSEELDLFVALSDSGIGVTFTITSDLNIEYNQSTIPVGRWSSVAYSDEIARFVATSYAGAIGSIYSDDGLNWTNGSLQKNPWSKVLWIPSLDQFFAVANTGENNVFASTDGITWVEHDTTGGYWRDLAWSPALNMFTIVSSAYDINNASSTDGSTFTEYKSRRLSSIDWSDDLGGFVAQIVPDNLYYVEQNYNVLVGKIITPTPTNTRTVTPTPTNTPTPSVTPSFTPSATLTPTPTITRTATVTATVTPTLTPSVTMTLTPTPTPTSSVAPTVTPSVTASVTPTVTTTPTPTGTPDVTSTVTPTVTATVSPTVTFTPTRTYTPTPSVTATITPTVTTTPPVTPSVTATITPTVTQTRTRTPIVTQTPTRTPSYSPMYIYVEKESSQPGSGTQSDPYVFNGTNATVNTKAVPGRRIRFEYFGGSGTGTTTGTYQLGTSSGVSNITFNPFTGGTQYLDIDVTFSAPTGFAEMLVNVTRTDSAAQMTDTVSFRIRVNKN